MSDIADVPYKLVSKETTYSRNIQDALQALETKFRHAVKKYLQQKETEGQVITEADAISFVGGKTKIGHKAQIAATFSFIALYDYGAGITPKEILEAQTHDDLPTIQEIIEQLPDHENDHWKLDWIDK